VAEEQKSPKSLVIDTECEFPPLSLNAKFRSDKRAKEAPILRFRRV
jgi:hypothetical protein